MFKKLPPSETLFNLIRCILICHDVLKINDKLSGASQDELVLMQMIEDKCQLHNLFWDPDGDIFVVLASSSSRDLDHRIPVKND